MQDDLGVGREIDDGNTLVRVLAVEGVHPAGIGAVGEFAQTVDGGNIHASVPIVVTGRVGIPLFVHNLL